MSVSASSNGLEYFEGSLFWYSSKEFFAKMFFFDFILACINIKQIWNASKFFIRIQMYCSARLKLVRCDGFYWAGSRIYALLPRRPCIFDPALFPSCFCLFWSGIFDGCICFLHFFILSCSLFLRSMIDPSLYTLAADKTCCRRNFALSWHSNSIFNDFLRNFRFWLRNLLWLFLSSIITQNWNSVLLLWCPLCFQCLDLSHFQMLFHSDSLVPSYHGDVLGFVRWGKSWRQEEAGFTRSVWPIWNALEPDRSLCFKGFML